MSNEAFVPQGYTAPTSGGGFTKIESGENRFRILSNPLLMWVVWGGGKPTRFPYDPDKKPAKPEGENASVKHAWGLVVYNYQTEKVEVMELDKMTLINPLLAHAQDADWGHPKHYDVIFKKEGSGKDGTKYSFVAKPKSEPKQEIVDAYLENPVDLSQLLVENGNPFLSAGSSEDKKPASKAAKTVTPENWVEGDAIPDGYEVKEGTLSKKGLPF